jgi:hypothetical protein
VKISRIPLVYDKEMVLVVLEKPPYDLDRERRVGKTG